MPNNNDEIKFCVYGNCLIVEEEYYNENKNKIDRLFHSIDVEEIKIYKNYDFDSLILSILKRMETA